MNVLKTLLNNIPRPILIQMSKWARPFLDIYYRGSKYTDPINQKSYRKFLPYGYVKIRENVLSPGTLSLERHRLLWLYLQKETDLLNKNLKVLHIAPEQAFYKKFKKNKNWEYITSDLNSPLADVKADITKLPFKDNTFDLIFCNHVLEHIKEDKKAMKELYRVMKPGGTGFFQIPLDQNREKSFEDDSITDPHERSLIFGQYDHVRVYGMDYFDKLKDAGFEVEAIDYSARLNEEDIKTYCLQKGELLPVVKKL